MAKSLGIPKFKMTEHERFAGFQVMDIIYGFNCPHCHKKIDSKWQYIKQFWEFLKQQILNEAIRVVESGVNRQTCDLKLAAYKGCTEAIEWPEKIAETMREESETLRQLEEEKINGFGV